MRKYTSLQYKDSQAKFASAHENFENGRGGIVHRVLFLVSRFEVLASWLYRIRSTFEPNSTLRQKAESYVSDVSLELVGHQPTPQRTSIYSSWVKRYRSIWRQNMSLFLFTSVVFIASSVISWNVVQKDPGYAQVLSSQHMVEKIIDQQRWFDDIQKSPPLIGLQIAVNNIRVSFSCFVLAALMGIGGLLLLIYNGAHFGAMISFCQIHGFDQALIEFVLAHGPIELTIVIAATFAGFIFGRVFYMRPYRLFRKRLAQASSDAICILVGVLPWLVVAAIIECFVSPWPTIPFEVRVAVGAIAAAAFWLWTLWPSPKPSSNLD